MAGEGVAPLDPSTDVGQVRAHIGDTAFAPLDPPVPGRGEYEWMSDAEILAMLATAGGSIARATGYAMLGLARDFAARGRTIKTDDLSIDSRQRGTDFLSIAKSWLAEADSIDAQAAGDIFDIAPFGGRPFRPFAFPGML